MNKDFLIEFIYNSNKIEGSKIPKKEVASIVKHNTVNHINTNEVREVLNSIDTMEHLLRQNRLSRELILECYNRFTEVLYMDNGILYPRGYRNVDVYIGNNKGADPKDINKLIYSLSCNFNALVDRKGITEQDIYKFHVDYETIHPFIDGNGRTGRMLMNFLLIKHGYDPIIIFEENKQAYYTAIEKCRKGRTGWDKFFINQRKKTEKLFTYTDDVDVRLDYPFN